MKLKDIIRHLVQIGSITFFIFLFLGQDYLQAANPFFTWAGWLDPLTGLAGLIANHWPLLAVLSLSAVILSVFAGRLFCGWLCPVGGLLDLLAPLKKILKWRDWRLGRKTGHLLEFIRWMLFGVVIGLIIMSRTNSLSMNPFALWPRAIYRISSGLIPWSLGVLIVTGFIIFPRFWCRFFCPTGTLFNLAGRFRGKRSIIGAECRHCCWCIRSCPMQNIDPGPQIGPDCLNCGHCKQICPVKDLPKPKNAPGSFNEARRDFLVATVFGLGTLIATSAVKAVIGKPVAASPSRWPRLLRPPGALTEEKLVQTCNRCGQCLQVCPSQALVPAGLEAGLAGFWTPRFLPRQGRCMFCMACGQVCPTKALAPVPLETVRLGQAQIDPFKCIAWAEGVYCLLCVETCPTRAIRMDEKNRPVIDLATCNGCGACEANCPLESSAAILTNLGETRRS